MELKAINQEVTQAEVAAVVGKELVKAQKATVDLIASATASTQEADRKAPEKDALLSQKTPKGGNPSKEELARFYQLLAALGIMYRIQMQGFDSTMDVLQVQSNMINKSATKVADYTKQVIAIQLRIQKEQEGNPWWEQILKAVPMLIVGALAAVATGGTAAGVIALAVGLTLTGMSIHGRNGGKSGFDELCEGVDEMATAIKGSPLTAEEKKWINFGFKIGLTLVVAAATAGASAWAASKVVENTAIEAAEETAETIAQKGGGFWRATKRQLGGARKWLATPRGVAVRSFIDTTNSMLSKFTSMEDGQAVTIYTTMGKAGAGLETALGIAVVILDAFSGTATTTKNVDSKLGLIGSLLGSGKLMGATNTIVGASEAAVSTNQAIVSSQLGALYKELSNLRADTVKCQGDLVAAQDQQSLLDNALQRDLGQISGRSSGVFAMEQLMNQTMTALYRG